jgi:hypothetical protein
MPWASLDDGFHGDPRIIEAGLAAAGLYACLTTYSARYLTDGTVPRRAATQLLDAGETAPLDALVRVGLVVATDDGYHLPDYLKGNWTREKTEAERAATAERKRRWAERRARERNGVPNDAQT